MKLSELAKDILFSTNLDSKLQTIDKVEYDLCEGHEIPKMPGRGEKIAFSSEQVKFPKKNSLKVESNRGLALHFFANHELLAIEMMAAALYCYPSRNEEDIKFKKGIVAASKDEQKHFKR